MDVQFTPAQASFIRQAIDSGRLQREEDVIREALSLWEERERRRLTLFASVQQAEASLARGEGRHITSHDQVVQLADDIKSRGLARLAREQNMH